MITRLALTHACGTKVHLIAPPGAWTTPRGRTITRTRTLAAEERVGEISRMLGGNVAPTEAASYAQQLINEARSAD